MAVPDRTQHLEGSRTSAVVNGSGDERRLQSSTTGNVDGNYRTDSPKFKQRKVSAVRTFPPGCGRFAARVSSGPTGRDIDVGGIKSEEHTSKTVDALSVPCTVPEIENECQPTGVSQGLPIGVSEGTSKLEQTNGVEDEIENSGAVTREEQVAKAEELDSTVAVEPEKDSNPEVTDMSVDMPNAVLAGAQKDMTQLDDSLARPASNSLEKKKTYNYPPRRKVSAVRVFPLFCGRNSPVLKKENKDMEELNALHNGEAVKWKMEIDANKKEDTSQNQDSQKGEVDGNASCLGGDEVQVEPGPLAIVSWRKEEELKRRSLEMGMAEKDAECDCVGSPPESNQNQVSPTKEATENSESVDMEKPTGKEIVIYTNAKRPEKKLSDVSRHEERSLEKEDESEHLSERAIVLGVMASPNSPWKSWNQTAELSYKGSVTENKGKQPKAEPSSDSWKKKKSGSSDGKSNKFKKGLILNEKPSNEGIGEMVVWEPESSSELEEQTDDFFISVRPRAFSVNPLPFGNSSSGGEDDNKTETVTRNKVRETLRLFQAVCRKLLQEQEAKSKQEDRRKRVDLEAAKILKTKGRFVNTGKPIIGDVAGVEVGDEFQYRVELNIIGLHRALQAGIDYVKQCGEILATSIVSSGAYEDVLEHPDFLIYTGQGGNVIGKDKEPEDQKLERGNLALSNSISGKNPVRVIRGLRETRASDSSDTKHRTSILYTYDGLYLVERCWQELGQHGKLVYKFRLNRIPGQPELAWKTVKKSKRYEAREGLCVRDISQGQEKMPIGAVNTVDNEKPPSFNYITRVIYPDWCRRLPPVGCDCSSECSDSEKCSCAVKNGGEIPYNYNGAIVEAKPLVYECGPSCKCPISCHNRVSQRGIKFPLEIFKTEMRGWGVRSLTSIPSGSFICEYVGELLDDKQAEQRAGNDEYLFDIGNSYNDNNMHEELSCLIPDAHSVSLEVVEELGFTIDAAIHGNVGRFINHSCSPNLYAQNVLYDNDDKRIPHIMFFAAENIPPLQELTYHYNYMVDHVRDAHGNIKMKSCFCGSPECIGRMY